MKKTKIVCTIGPASESVDMLEQLMENGMNVCRLNFSHGDYAEHAARIQNIRAAARKNNKVIGIMLDTKGPEIRTHSMENDKIFLEKGSVVRVAMQEVIGTKERFSITYSDLIHDVKIGSTILLDDGLVALAVTGFDYDNQDIITTVRNSGFLSNKKGVNVPNVKTNLPGITEKDAADIEFGIKQGVDFIAASFVRSAKDVLEIAELLEKHGASHIRIIPKIENQEGIDNIDEILKVSQGLMVARGDLGVEIPAEEVPIVQKALIRKCNELGKPVITATQMLDSMQRNPRPTRAEAGDVANAIFDGTDAVMLSGETAAGDYPLEAVQTMANICVRTEVALRAEDTFKLKVFSKVDVTEAIGRSVAHTAKNLGVRTIVAATQSGHTARMISKYRPNAQILALTFDERASRGLTLTWGVHPYLSPKIDSTDDMFDLATRTAMETNYAKEGDLIIITAGLPIGETGTTNMMKVELISTELLRANGIGRFKYSGRVVVAKDAAQANDQVQDGDVLVVQTTDEQYTSAIKRAGALIVEQGGLTSHAAVVGIALNKPVIVGATDASQILADQDLVTLDTRRGIVYQGKTRV